MSIEQVESIEQNEIDKDPVDNFLDEIFGDKEEVSGNDISDYSMKIISDETPTENQNIVLEEMKKQSETSGNRSYWKNIILGDENLNLKLKVQNIFEQAITDLGTNEVTKFSGFLYEDSNLRGDNLSGAIRFNEKFLNLDEQELQRWAHHEIQHTITLQEQLKVEDVRLPYLFILHPSVVNLHERMTTLYSEHKNREFPFRRPILPIPEKYADIKSGSEDYFSPFELLSLLRGYKCYLQQMKETEEPIHTDPSEFIEAFKPEDLKLLDFEYRIELGKSVLENKPEAAEPRRTKVKRTQN